MNNNLIIMIFLALKLSVASASPDNIDLYPGWIQQELRNRNLVCQKVSAERLSFTSPDWTRPKVNDIATIMKLGSLVLNSVNWEPAYSSNITFCQIEIIESIFRNEISDVPFVQNILNFRTSASYTIALENRHLRISRFVDFLKKPGKMYFSPVESSFETAMLKSKLVCQAHTQRNCTSLPESCTLLSETENPFYECAAKAD